MNIFSLIEQEQQRQNDTLQLIPSENHVSANVLRASGSVLMNKYSEGYPFRRYYEGNEIIDQIETAAQDEAKKLFGVPHVNVQPYSGSPANAAILMGLLEPGDTLMGLQLSSGGHLTHGHPKITFSGKFFRSVQFGLDDTAHIDMKALREMALQEKPKLIIVGTTAYPFILDYAQFAQIAEEVGAWLVADISHIAGLIAAGEHPSPVPHVHVIMTTTHKTLRGPRGAMIMVTQKGLDRDEKLADKIDKAVFPGLQGGPHDQTTAAIAIALQEANTPEFKHYAKQIRLNASALALELQKQGIKLVGGGTETHLMIIDAGEWGGGTQLAYTMAQAGLCANKNTIPNEPQSPFYPSGVRLGTPAVTSRGMKEKEMKQIAQWISRVEKITHSHVLPKGKAERAAFLKEFYAWADKNADLADIRQEVTAFAQQFPIPTLN